MYCEKCGNKLNDGAEFCPNCGTPVQSNNKNNQDATPIDNQEQQDYNHTIKSREEIKAIAKEAVANQRSNAILIPFLVSLISTAGTTLEYIPFIGGFAYLATVLFVLVLNVGVSGAFIKVYNNETVDVGEPFSNLKYNFGRKLGSMCLTILYSWLWALLFVIPGIIKMLAYSMTPYILSEYPNVTATDAIKLSMRMTDGYKDDLFVLGLSWLGWQILNFFTLGILGIVFLTPYMNATRAGFYQELRDQALASGKIKPEELQ